MKKTALVTGANRGLGLAFCKYLVRENYKIIALCRESSAELQKLDLTVLENIDMRDFLKIKNLAHDLKEEHIDLLINNAAIGLEDDINNLSLEKIQDHFLVNAYAPLVLSISLLNLMKPESKIAFITSHMGSITDNESGGSYAYRISKAALNMIGKNLSIDLKHKQISIAVLSPGMVDTDMLRALNITTGADASVVVEKLMYIINNLNLGNTGNFWHIDNNTLPW